MYIYNIYIIYYVLKAPYIVLTHHASIADVQPGKLTTAEQWQQKADAAAAVVWTADGAQQWEQQPSPAWDRSPAVVWMPHGPLQQSPVWMQQQYAQAQQDMTAVWQQHAEREMQRQQEQLCWRY